MIDFSQNYFALFGLPQRYGFDPEQLDAAYRALQRVVHPDRYAAAGDAERRVALQSSARVNEAYRALKDPVARAQYLLSLNGVDALSETDTQLPLDFLERQLDRREGAADAVSANDSSRLAAIVADVRVEANDLVGTLSHALDENASLSDARTLVRELKFLSKLAQDLDAMQSSLDD